MALRNKKEIELARNKEGYLSAAESRRISRENRRITYELENKR